MVMNDNKLIVTLVPPNLLARSVVSDGRRAVGGESHDIQKTVTGRWEERWEERPRPQYSRVGPVIKSLEGLRDMG